MKNTAFGTVRPLILVGAIFAGMAVSVTSAQAQDWGRDQSAKLVDAMPACRQETDGAARLNCFDRAGAELARARDAKDIVVIDRDELRKTRRSLFGFSLPKLKLFGNDRDEEAEPEIKEIQGKIARVAPTADDRWTFYLEDGARWQTTEIPRLSPQVGQSVVIKRASMGSFLATFGTTTARARRVN